MKANPEIRGANKIGAANSRSAGQFRLCGFLFTTVAFRSHSPAAVADLYRCVSNRSKNMNEASSCKKCGVALYTLCAVCVLAGVPLNFSGFLKLGGLLIGLGVLTAVSTAIRLGHVKQW